MEKLGHYFIGGATVKRRSHSGKWFASFLKTKHTLFIQTGNWPLAIHPTETFTRKLVYKTCVQMSFSEWVSKLTMVHAYCGVVLSHDPDGSPEHCAEWKKPIQEGYPSRGFTYMPHHLLLRSYQACNAWEWTWPPTSYRTQSSADTDGHIISENQIWVW